MRYFSRRAEGTWALGDSRWRQMQVTVVLRGTGLWGETLQDWGDRGHGLLCVLTRNRAVRTQIQWGHRHRLGLLLLFGVDVNWLRHFQGERNGEYWNWLKDREKLFNWNVFWLKRFLPNFNYSKRIRGELLFTVCVHSRRKVYSSRVPAITGAMPPMPILSRDLNLTPCTLQNEFAQKKSLWGSFVGKKASNLNQSCLFPLIRRLKRLLKVLPGITESVCLTRDTR